MADVLTLTKLELAAKNGELGLALTEALIERDRLGEFADDLIGELEQEHNCTEVDAYRATLAGFRDGGVRDPGESIDVKRLAIALRTVMAEPSTGDAIFAVGRGKWDEFAERVAHEYRAWRPVAPSNVGGTDG